MTGPNVGYRVEVTANFTFTISEALAAPSGSSAADLEELIDRNWWWICGSTDVLLESSWELQSFEELADPGGPWGVLGHTTKAQPFQKAPIRSLVR